MKSQLIRKNEAILIELNEKIKKKLYLKILIKINNNKIIILII